MFLLHFFKSGISLDCLAPPFFTTLESAAEKGGKSGISLDVFAPLFKSGIILDCLAPLFFKVELVWMFLLHFFKSGISLDVFAPLF